MISELECYRAVNHAIKLLDAVEGEVELPNRFDFPIRLIKADGVLAGATCYKQSVGYTIDFDCRCSKCEVVLTLGSVDIDGPYHPEAVYPCMRLERSVGPFAVLFQVSSIKYARHTPSQAARWMLKTLAETEACGRCEDDADSVIRQISFK